MSFGVISIPVTCTYNGGAPVVCGYMEINTLPILTIILLTMIIYVVISHCVGGGKP